MIDLLHNSKTGAKPKNEVIKAKLFTFTSEYDKLYEKKTSKRREINSDEFNLLQNITDT